MEEANPKILIVDDSEDDAFLLSAQIKRIESGCEFLRVDNASDMRAALAQQDWDLVISDHAMPGFDSVEALRILREHNGEIPFVIYSGNLQQELGISAMHNGARDFVYKNNPERMLPVTMTKRSMSVIPNLLQRRQRRSGGELIKASTLS